MIGVGERIGGQIMPRVQLTAITPKHRAWNKGRIIGQKRPLLPKQVWAIRARLELAGNLRDLTLFNVTIESASRGCDLVKLAVSDLPQRCCQTNRLKHQKPQEGAYSHASLVISKSLFIMKPYIQHYCKVNDL